MLHSKDHVMSHLYRIKDGAYQKSISGWWKDSTFELYEVFDALQKESDIQGNLCEVGTWHGRSFLPLRNFASENEMCVGVDIFHDQKYYNILLQNITNCFGSLDGCDIIKSDSKSIGNRLEQYSPVRIFYIDGDHSYEGTLTDLRLAETILSDEGIMFLDDYVNPRYGPAIVKAVNTFLKENEEFSLAFSSTQKIFLCKKPAVDFYVDGLLTHLPDWIQGKDEVYKELINFEHPVGLNSWQIQNNESNNSRKST